LARRPSNTSSARSSASPVTLPSKSPSLSTRPISVSPSPRRDAFADHKMNAQSIACWQPSSPAARKEPLDDGKQSKTSIETLLAGSLKTISYDPRVAEQRHDWRHGFTDFIDVLVGTQYSRLTEWFDEKTQRLQPLYQIYGEVEFGGSKPEPFIFDFCFNQLGQCYHRFGAKKSKKEFINDLVKNIKHTTQNPTPKESMRMNEAPQEFTVRREDKVYKFQLTPPPDIIHFTDENGVKFKLFKMQ
jgi:hypothetical protein